MIIDQVNTKTNSTGVMLEGLFKRLMKIGLLLPPC